MKYKDNRTGLFIADSLANPFEGIRVTHDMIQKAAEPMILSASGWRKVFASSLDEEDASEGISPADRYIAAYIALSLAEHLDNKGTVLLGMDARPTGPALADVITRVLLARGLKVEHIFIASAPEIMADSAVRKNDVDAFLYISASHNPIGHNGIKFGKDGGVYTGKETNLLIATFRELLAEEGAMKMVEDLVSSLDISEYEAVLDNIPSQKKIALESYTALVNETALNGNPRTLDVLKENLRKNPVSIVAELNGSARSVTIDREYLKELGINVKFLNDRPRQVVHAIVPEGENLELCRTELEKAYESDRSFKFGFVPDNDGDRGNLVYIKDSTGKAEILQAQEVFALVVMIELASTRRENPDAKIAVAVNGPTSMRINDLSEALGVEVFRAEVGEANVVEKAQILRDSGYIVRILGEGSNGGNITHPAKVRDPLNTVMSLTKLLTDQSLFDFYLAKCGKPSIPVSIENAIASLPVYTTTGAFSKDGKMHVTKSHGDLKDAYEKEFIKAFDQLKELGIVSYEVKQTEGTAERTGMGKEFRNPPYKGGYKVLLYNDRNEITDYIWMRGSGTEPIFRVLVDTKGDDQERHDKLLKFHRGLIEKADRS